MIHQRHFPPPCCATSAPSEAPPFSQTYEKWMMSWHVGGGGGRQHTTLRFLVAPLRQWIFYELPSEVHKHWEKSRRKAEQATRMGSGGKRGLISGSLRDVFLASSNRRHLLWLTGRFAAVNKTQTTLSAFLRLALTPPSAWPCLIIAINAWIACIQVWSGSKGLRLH